MRCRRLRAVVVALLLVLLIKLFHRVVWRARFLRGYLVYRVFIPFFSVSSESVLYVAKGILRKLKVFSFCDIGSGSGYISIELAKLYGSGYFIAVDLSSDAVHITRANSKIHGVSDRIDVVQCHLGSCLRERSVDVCASNPPYLPCPERLSRDLCCGIDGAIYIGVLIELVRVSRLVSIVSASSLTPCLELVKRGGAKLRAISTRGAGLDRVSIYVVKAG